MILFKQWFLNKFFKDSLANIKCDAGIEAFRLAHKDVLEGFEGDVEERAKELAQENLEKLLTIIDERLIVSVDPRAKVVLIGGEAVDEARLANLRAEAHFFIESDLWKVIYETPKKLAESAMFKDDGTLETQLLKGRAILYTLATQDKIVQMFKNIGT